MNWIRRFLNTAHVGFLASLERRIPFLSIDGIELLQRARLHSIVRHAYDTVPFYRRVMDERGLRPRDFQTVADLTKLPLLDSFAVRANLEQFVSTRYDEGSRIALHSSGSHSYVRRVFYWDSTSMLRRLAYAERDRAVLCKLVGQSWGQRQLFILPSGSLPMGMRARWDAQTMTPRSLAHRRFIPAEQPLEVAVEEINAHRPQVVFSFGSYADQFFRFLTDRRLAIAVPRVWVYGGDMLSPGGRDLMEKQFGCTVYSTYQTVEAGRLGFQCERCQGFHLNVDLCAVRLVDQDGQIVAPGQSGEVVISNLHNRAMVLLNFRLGDRGVLDPAPCPCGRSLPLLDRLEGRTSEVIYCPDGRQISSLVLLSQFREELKVALRAQVSQTAPGHLLWRIVPFASAEREVLRRRLLEKAPVVLGEGIEVAIEFVEEIPGTPQGKFLNITTTTSGTEAGNGYFVEKK